MTLKLIISILLFAFSHVIFANQNNGVVIEQLSNSEIYNSKLQCNNLITAGKFQQCRLQLHKVEKTVSNTEIFINGGMPSHNHGLPTAPKVVWSDDESAYLIKGLKFSMPGQWLLKFKVNAEPAELKDEIIMQLEVN